MTTEPTEPAEEPVPALGIGDALADIADQVAAILQRQADSLVMRQMVVATVNDDLTVDLVAVDVEGTIESVAWRCSTPPAEGMTVWVQQWETGKRLCIGPVATGVADFPGVPFGVPVPFFGATAPAGWLLCDGSTFDGDEYPKLAEILGGTTLPDMRGRYVVGVDANHARLATGGSRFLPDHAHTLPSHSHGAGTLTAGGYSGLLPSVGSGALQIVASSAHSHTVTGTTATGGSGNSGNPTSATVNDEPPWIGLNWITRAG